MSKTPIAFLSYVHTDDQHENGRLTQFRERLSGEVRMQTGEAFEIFQDRKDIKWGQQWRERIEGTIDNTTFLIPVITPSFFKSPACRSELERFLKREETLGREDLILPVYYVECPMLSVEAKRKKDPLAMAVAERQWADWRELRFEPLTTPEVGKRIAGIARQIVESMERGRRESENSDGRLGASSRHDDKVVVRPLVRSILVEIAEVSTGPQPKTDIPTISVDAWGRGDFQTLAGGLQAAKPGTRILVRPGLYQEAVVIDKPVEILGDGQRQDIIIQATGTDAVLFKSSMGKISNLTIHQMDEGLWAGVNVAQGRLHLEECDISSQGNTCVAVHDGADPIVRRNRIHEGAEAGVIVYNNGRGTFEDNDVLGSGRFCVVIGEGGNPTMRHNRLGNAKGIGVVIGDRGAGTLEDNEIFGNSECGVLVTQGGKPILRRNRIQNNGYEGVWIQSGGGGIFEHNDLSGNAMGAWDIHKSALPNIKREGNLE